LDITFFRHTGHGSCAARASAAPTGSNAAHEHSRMLLSINNNRVIWIFIRVNPWRSVAKKLLNKAGMLR
jgi:hypothetical protein